MVTLLSFLTLLGFEFLYHTSQRAQFARIALLDSWAKKSSKVLRIAGFAVLGLSLAGFQILYGLGSGTFYFLAALMFAGALTIILSPIRYFQFRWIGLAFLVFLIFELS